MERLTIRTNEDSISFECESIGDIVRRLAVIEDILGDEYDLDRLREMAQEQTCDTTDVTLAAEATLRNLVIECKENLEAVKDSILDAQSKVNDLISRIRLYDL